MFHITATLHRARRLAALICMVVAVQSFAAALASSPLEYVPADVSGVVSLQRPAVTAEHITQFARGVEPTYRGLDWKFLSDTMDLWEDCWDQSKPAVFVMTKPTFDFLTTPDVGDTRTVFVFTPKEIGRFEKLLNGREGAIQRIERAGRRYYVMMRDGYVFYAGQRRAIRSMRRVRPESSLFASLSPEEKRTLNDCDVFVHLPLAAWQDRLNSFALIATNMARMGAVEEDPKLAAAGQAMFEYLGRGLQRIISDMKSLTLALAFDGKVFKLVHHHSFRTGGPVSDYLGNVERSGFECFDVMPERAFFMIGAFDWHMPARDSISVRLLHHVFAQDLGEGKVNAQLRRDINNAANACYDQINGSFFVVLPKDGNRLSPVDLLGGYAVRDSDVALKQMRLLQDLAGHLSAGFVNGMYPGKFEQRSANGFDYDLMTFSLDKMPEGVRQQLISLYGEGVHLEEMKLGKDRILHTITSGSASVVDMGTAQKTGKNLLNNEAVSQLRSQMPKQQNGVVVFDLGRSFAALPQFVLETTQQHLPPASAPSVPVKQYTYQDNDGTGPLLGWSCAVTPTSFTGCFVISANDAVRAAEHAKDAINNISDVLAGTQSGSASIPKRQEAQ